MPRDHARLSSDGPAIALRELRPHNRNTPVDEQPRSAAHTGPYRDPLRFDGADTSSTTEPGKGRGSPDSAQDASDDEKVRLGSRDVDDDDEAETQRLLLEGATYGSETVRATTGSQSEEDAAEMVRRVSDSPPVRYCEKHI